MRHFDAIMPFSPKIRFPSGLRKVRMHFPKVGRDLEIYNFVQEGQQKNENSKICKKIPKLSELSDQTNFSTKVQFGKSSHNLRLF